MPLLKRSLFEDLPDAEQHREFLQGLVAYEWTRRVLHLRTRIFPNRAAQYVRMSTEHQQYSPESQLEVIRQYAASHAMEIVQAYSDHGRSGLNIAGREGLNRLMTDVENKQAHFSALLVYDVSRWGRFQDVDESAYYEYVLKRAGIRVHYCAEQFENDGSMASSVLETLKRSMASGIQP